MHIVVFIRPQREASAAINIAQLRLCVWAKRGHCKCTRRSRRAHTGSLLRRKLGAEAAERLERKLIAIVHVRDHAVGVEDADDRLVRPVAGGRVLCSRAEINEEDYTHNTSAKVASTMETNTVRSTARATTRR